MGSGTICLGGRGHLRDPQGRAGVDAFESRCGEISRRAWVMDSRQLFCGIYQFSLEDAGQMLRTLSLGILASAIAFAASAQDSQYSPVGQQIPAPVCNYLYHAFDNAVQPGCAPNAHERWLRDLNHWRTERRIRVAYDPSRYDLPALQWTQSSFIQPQMMVQDRYFYDPVAGRYTVDRYVDDLERRYGGIDSVLIWPTHPNMGIDNRNQHDLIRSMPGGVAGVKAMIADFHRRGVRVLFPMMLWDQGTRDFGTPEPQALAEELAAVGADGINGDTMQAVARAYRTASDKTGHPLVFEPESLNVDEALAYNNMNWGQATPTAATGAGGGRRGAQLVSKYKWLEPRHMTNISDRYP